MRMMVNFMHASIVDQCLLDKNVPLRVVVGGSIPRLLVMYKRLNWQMMQKKLLKRGKMKGSN